MDDNKSTSTYISSMTGRRSPGGNMKRTTFTKDIKKSEKDS